MSQLFHTNVKVGHRQFSINLQSYCVHKDRIVYYNEFAFLNSKKVPEQWREI